ncbi:patatin-like phospholipase [Colletotrichum zoysiae]|uniref:Patatin-like phospholipase n=1 Tax=Colletotrichum zoysiae TaxID=1216348 RepID=A0AAD9M0H3_9PEZI|nr:patatin-like phospholipase [Colletotrichum zoysiae]
MLGRLEMSVQECITEYERLMVHIFPQHVVDATASKVSKIGDYLGVPSIVKWGVHQISSPFMRAADILETKARAHLTRGKWQAHELERAIEALIERNLPKSPKGATEIPLVSKNENSCKVFVTAGCMGKKSSRPPVLLRSYKNAHEKSELPEIKLWEAARATSAAPTYFKPLTVDGHQFVDGGLKSNNPLGWFWSEVITTFGAERNTACFLSLGTAIPPSQVLPSPQADVADPGKPVGMLAGLARIATNTEIVNMLFGSLFNALAPAVGADKYWRFSVGDGLCDWVKMNGVNKWRITSPEVKTKEYIAMDDPMMRAKIANLAREFIATKKGGEMVRDCAKALSSVPTP